MLPLLLSFCFLTPTALATPAHSASGLPSVDFSNLAPSAAVRPQMPNGLPHQVLARLITDRDPVVPGEPFRLGLHLTQDPDWHTYWKSPGDVGQPTTLSWDLPDGTRVSPWAFPIPKHFGDADMSSFGYDEQVLFFSEVTLPTNFDAQQISVGVDATWLVCDSTCIPGQTKLTLPLTVSSTSTQTPWKTLFEAFDERLPTDFEQVDALDIVGHLSHDAVRPWDSLTVAFEITPRFESAAPWTDVDTASPWPTFTPIVDASRWYVEETRVHRLEDGQLFATVKAQAIAETPPNSDAIGGLFQLNTPDGWVRTEMSVPIPWQAEGTQIHASEKALWSLLKNAPQKQAAEQPEPPLAGPPVDPLPLPPRTPSAGLGGMLLFAFIGGVLLNIMPCVFPVLTLKLFGLVSHADASPADQKKSGLAYTLGILVSFWALAAAVLLLKSTGGGVGWGFQFQSPVYVISLATLVFVFALSLFGVFELPAIGADRAGNASANASGLSADFVNGVFATLVATPCTAPFLGPAVGYAFAQSSAVIVLFFSVIGLGLAFPFLLVAFIPALFKLLPHPGAWMEQFKQFMGFTLIATVVWMVDILNGQLGADGAIGYLGFLCFVSIGAWIFGQWGGVERTHRQQLFAGALGFLVIALGANLQLNLTPAEAAECGPAELDSTQLDFSKHIPWQPFNPSTMKALEHELRFVDFTADWCLTCKVNEKTVLETEAVRGEMAKLGFFPLKGDWTRQDPYISDWLKRYGRAGVPFYLVFPKNGEPIPLPEALTTAQVLTALNEAASR